MNDLERLVKYWNQAFSVNLDEEMNQDYKELAPSLKLYEALKELSKKKNILDYGTGHGFASIIMAKENDTNITAVDMAPNAIKMASKLAQFYQVPSINFKVIQENDLNHYDTIYDGIFCSNVLDVIPLEITRNILEYFSKVTSKDASIVIGLNYYLDLSEYKTNERTKVNPPYFYIDGVLRLMSKTDEEWIEIFKPWFKVKKLIHFSWPCEEKEKRRLFILERK